MSLEIHQFPYLSDNYGVLLHDPASNMTACVDAGDAAATLQALQARNWTLDFLLITHHHADHTGGLTEIKQKTGARVIGPKAGASQKINGLDQQVQDGDSFKFAEHDVQAVSYTHLTLPTILLV